MSNFSAISPYRFRPTRFFHSHSATQRATVAVSACLTGEKVRYDGTDKRLALYSLLQSELELVPVCPETGAGLGVPRPPVQLIAYDDGVRAQGRDHRELDVSAQLQDYAVKSLHELTRDFSLCGYLWKSRSPSCGLGSTPLFNSERDAIGFTDGLQAAYFHGHLPHICHREDAAITTEYAMMAFVLCCRLVFDFMYANTTPLQTLHHHYEFLIEHFDRGAVENLQALHCGTAKKDYLAAFLNGCSQLSDEKLLKIFQ